MSILAFSRRDTGQRLVTWRILFVHVRLRSRMRANRTFVSVFVLVLTGMASGGSACGLNAMLRALGWSWSDGYHARGGCPCVGPACCGPPVPPLSTGEPSWSGPTPQPAAPAPPEPVPSGVANPAGSDLWPPATQPAWNAPPLPPLSTAPQPVLYTGMRPGWPSAAGTPAYDPGPSAHPAQLACPPVSTPGIQPPTRAPSYVPVAIP